MNVEDGEKRCGGGGCCLAEDVAGEGAEGHCDEKGDEADRGAEERHEGHRLEALETLLGAADNRADVAEESADEDQDGERAGGNLEAFVEERHDEVGAGDAEDEENERAGEDVVDEAFHLAVFAVGRVGVDVLREDDGDDGKRNGQERGELLEREDRAEFLRADVFRHEPQPDERLDRIARAAREKDHRGVPPEVSDALVDAVEKGFHGRRDVTGSTYTPSGRR